MILTFFLYNRYDKFDPIFPLWRGVNMRRGRIFIFLALILIIGLAVVALVFRQFVLPVPSSTVSPQQSATVQIFIAGQNIPQGEPITDDLLSTISIPQENVVSVMFMDDQRAELVGKVARYPIDQGVVITRSMVSDGSVAAGGPEWASQIPQGMTAISIPTSRLESVAFGVRDGAHVDVNACFLFIDVDPAFQTELPNEVALLVAPGTEVTSSAGETSVTATGVTLSVTSGVGIQGRTEVESAFQQGIYVVPSESQRPRLVCQMVLQNVAVLKLGSFPLPQTQVVAEQTDPEAAQVAQPQEIPDILTLIVTPQDSVTLSYLVYGGAKLSMSLRNVLDDSRVATEAATLQFLLSQYNIPVPAKLPYTVQPRIDALSAPLQNNTEPTPAPQE
jgi:Flp pilus assembly protein CpaB